MHAFDVPSRIAREGPITLVRGDGPFVWDDRGRRYLDGLSSLWNVSVGHGRAEIARAMARQARRLAYAPTLLGYSSPPAQALAERVAAWAPPGLSRAILTSGGSESNESVIRLARLYWKLRGRKGKTRFVTLHGAYHGSTSGAASLTSLRKFHSGFEPLMPGVVRMARPHCYRCELGLTFPRCGLACADLLEETIRRVGADRIAAFLAEPVQGVGGVVAPPAGYFEAIREICDRHEVLFVADEVITGFGRTGKRFGIMHWNAVPDMLVFAKGVTGGYAPLGGVLLHDRIYEAFVGAGDELTLSHGFTYSGHPVACAAGLATLDVLEGEKLVSRARRLGRRLARRLDRLRRHAIVGDVRAFGMMGAVELVRDRTTRRAVDERVATAVRDGARDRGVLVRASGNVVVLCPPLIVTTAELDQVVQAVDSAIADLGDNGRVS